MIKWGIMSKLRSKSLEFKKLINLSTRLINKQINLIII